MDILIGISSALGGSLLTCVAFIFNFSNKVSVMQNTLNELKKSFDSHLYNTPTCEFHNRLSSDVAVLKSKVGDN